MSSDVVLKEPGRFISAVPAMLGFVPEQSLVIAALRHASDCLLEVLFVTRLDMPPAGQYSPLLDRITEICRRSDVVAALALIVDDRAVPERRYRRLVNAVRQRLTESGVVLAAAWSVPRIEEAAVWRNVESPQSHGLLPDPSSSQLAALQVFDGRVLRSSRGELADSLTVDKVLRNQVSAHLPQVVSDAQRRLARAIQINNPDAFTRMTLWQLMSAIAQLNYKPAIPPRTIAEVAVALRHKTVRDIMFGVAGGVHARTAEHLWGVLTRALPDPDRAEAATLLAFNAYRRGDGTLAGVALDQALAADPEHRMAVLLDVALQTAMAPSRLNRLVNTGIEAAADLRIDIGATATDSGLEVAR